MNILFSALDQIPRTASDENSRDLQRDLETAQPGVELLEVNGFLIRGNGRVDDVIMIKQQLERGDIFIVFNKGIQTVSIVPKEMIKSLLHAPMKM